MVVVTRGQDRDLIINPQGDDEIRPEIDRDIELLDLLIQLKAEGSYRNQVALTRRINQYISDYKDEIDAFYVNDGYANANGGEAKANFFAIIDSLNINPTHKKILMRNMMGILKDCVNEIINADEDQGRDDDIFKALDWIVNYNDSVGEELAEIIDRVAESAFTFDEFKDLKNAFSNTNVDILKVLLLPEVLNAKKQLGFDRALLIEICEKFNLDDSTENLSVFMRNIFSQRNVAHLASRHSSSELLYKMFMVEKWPENFDFHHKIIDPEYFGYITSKRMEKYVNTWGAPLHVMMSLDREDLRRIVEEPDLGKALKAIKSHKESYEGTIAASAAMATNSTAATIEITPDIMSQIVDALVRRCQDFGHRR